MPPCPYPTPPSAWPSRAEKPIRSRDWPRALPGGRPKRLAILALKYRFDGKEKRLALGVYPVVTLARAREEALGSAALANGAVDPSARKKGTRARRPNSPPPIPSKQLRAMARRSCVQNGRSTMLAT